MSKISHPDDSAGGPEGTDYWAVAFVLVGATLSWQVVREHLESAVIVGLLAGAGALIGGLLGTAVARWSSLSKSAVLLGFSAAIVALAAVLLW